MLQAKGISYLYPNEKNYLFTNVDFSIEEGSSVSIVGQSGSGKTTFLSILSGLLKPVDGEVFYKGQSIYELKQNKLSFFRKEKIGFMFQESYLIPQLTIKENCQILTNVTSESDSLFEKLASELNVYELKDRFPETLSGGEKQRVNLLRAMMHRPELIFADEPTGSLDQMNANIMSDVMFAVIKANGCSFVIVTHNEALAAKAQVRYKIQNQILKQYE